MRREGCGQWCPGWESNPHEEKSPEDFKSSASAIPPPGQRHYKLSESGLSAQLDSKDWQKHLGFWHSWKAAEPTAARLRHPK